MQGNMKENVKICNNLVYNENVFNKNGNIHL